MKRKEVEIAVRANSRCGTPQRGRGGWNTERTSQNGLPDHRRTLEPSTQASKIRRQRVHSIVVPDLVCGLYFRVSSENPTDRLLVLVGRGKAEKCSCVGSGTFVALA